MEKFKIFNHQIDWMGNCPECDDDLLEVLTTSPSDKKLMNGDTVECTNCGLEGQIETQLPDEAYVVWDEEQ